MPRGHCQRWGGKKKIKSMEKRRDNRKEKPENTQLRIGFGCGPNTDFKANHWLRGEEEEKVTRTQVRLVF